MFEGHCAELEEKVLPLTKYVKLTLVFVSNKALREKFNFCFSRVFH